MKKRKVVAMSGAAARTGVEYNKKRKKNHIFK